MAIFGKPRRRRRKGAPKNELGKGTAGEWKTVNKRLRKKYPRAYKELTPATEKAVKQLMKTGLSRDEALKRVD